MRGYGKKKGYVWIFVLLSFLLGNCAVDASESKLQNARNGVVRILAVYEDGISTGSGFGIGKAGKPTDTFVTNWHVVTDEAGLPAEVYILLDDDAVCIKEREYYEDGYYAGTEALDIQVDTSRLIPCTIIDMENQYPDVAVIRADRVIQERVALPLLSTENARTGQGVTALGYPGDADDYSKKITGTDDATYIDYEFYCLSSTESLVSSSGTISRFTLYAQGNDTKVIQSNANINHGNSGGPLVTENGAVIGINTYGIGESFYPTSIYIDYAMELLDKNGISYDVYKASFKLPEWVIPMVAVVLLLVAAGGIMISRQKKKDEEKEEEIKKLEDEVENLLNRWQNNTKQHDSGYRMNGIAGVFKGRRFAIGDSVKIGRGNDNHLRYPEDTRGVSGSHCEICMRNGKLYVIDRGSSYGTYLEKGDRIPTGAYVELNIGSRVYFGSKGV